MREIKARLGLRRSQQALLLPDSVDVLSGLLPVEALLAGSGRTLTLCLNKRTIATCFECDVPACAEVKIQYCSICFKHTFCSRRCWLQHVRSCHVPQSSESSESQG